MLAYTALEVSLAVGVWECVCAHTYLAANTYISTRIQSEQCGCVLSTDKLDVMFQLLQMIYSLNFFLRFTT